ATRRSAAGSSVRKARAPVTVILDSLAEPRPRRNPRELPHPRARSYRRRHGLRPRTRPRESLLPSRGKVKLAAKLPTEQLDDLRAASHDADMVRMEGLTGPSYVVILERVRHDPANGATVAPVCYHGRTMGTVKRHRSRPGRTAKISISLDRRDLAVLRGRARRLFEGNLSAVIAAGGPRG